MTATKSVLLEPWVQYAQPVPGARLVLLAFHHAGGAASAYRGWTTALADRGIEVWPVQLPGRENRFTEPYAVDLPLLVKTLAELVGPQLGDRPYAVYGHSAGAMDAYAFARHAVESGMRAPAHLLLGACRPPALPDPDFPIHSLDHDRFLARLLRYGRLPAVMLDHPDFLATMVDTARADLRLAETYPWPVEPALDVPLTVVGGVDDETVPISTLDGWGEATRRSFEVVPLPGGHFPEGAAEQRLMEVVRRALSTC